MQLLRDHIHRKPFVPFHVDLRDGRRILVDYPSVALAGPSAAFLGEDQIITFDCDEVNAITPVAAEAHS